VYLACSKEEGQGTYASLIHEHLGLAFTPVSCVRAHPTRPDEQRGVLPCARVVSHPSGPSMQATQGRRTRSLPAVHAACLLCVPAACLHEGPVGPPMGQPPLLPPVPRCYHWPLSVTALAVSGPRAGACVVCRASVDAHTHAWTHTHTHTLAHTRTRAHTALRCRLPLLCHMVCAQAIVSVLDTTGHILYQNAASMAAFGVQVSSKRCALMGSCTG